MIMNQWFYYNPVPVMPFLYDDWCMNRLFLVMSKMEQKVE